MDIRCRSTWARVAACWLCSLGIAAGAAAQTGKCCLPDGRGCRDVTQDQCDAAGGVFLSGQVCASPEDTCDGPVTGACCFAAGCSIVPQPSCPAGTPFFAGSACSPTLCTPPVTGACCRSGQCATTTRDDCIGTGGEWFEAQECTPTLCRIGACCKGPLACVLVTQNGCEAGTWVADGTCAPLFCVDIIGTCCRTSETCVVTTESDCPNGTFVIGAVCTATTCQTLVGACCQGTTCTMTLGTACSGEFQGLGTECGPIGNPTTCCPANFNAQGGVTVQDIFDFLAAYFAGDTRADFNGAGGITVQDIFDFLAAYFAGC